MRQHAKNPRTLTNKAYKNKIYELCRRVATGDKTAEQDLSDELENNSNARWAVKHWLKIRNAKAKEAATRGAKPVQARIKRRGRGDNAYKLFQGGAPGLGKRS